MISKGFNGALKNGCNNKQKNQGITKWDGGTDPPQKILLHKEPNFGNFQSLVNFEPCDNF
jgi:hypothetical protein